MRRERTRAALQFRFVNIRSNAQVSIHSDAVRAAVMSGGAANELLFWPSMTRITMRGVDEMPSAISDVQVPVRLISSHVRCSRKVLRKAPREGTSLVNIGPDTDWSQTLVYTDPNVNVSMTA